MVTPYLTQHSPPALVATLPPIEQISNEPGVRRVPEAVLSRRLLDVSVERTRLDDGAPGRRVDLDRGHPLEADDESSLDRGCASGEA